MSKKALWVFLLICFAASAGYSYDLQFSAVAEAIGGAGNDLDFNSATHESKWYASQRFKPRIDLKLNDNISLAGEYQISNASGAKGTLGGSFASDDNNFKILDSYLKISREGGDYIKAGWQDVSLPSFTFGNPFFSGHTSAVTLRGELSESTVLHSYFAVPLRTQDNMPKANSSNIISFIVATDKGSFKTRPYMSFARVDHSLASPYNWASADNKAVSYITTAGVAVQYAADDITTISFDGIYADENNKGSHYYEAKGSHLAFWRKGGKITER